MPRTDAITQSRLKELLDYSPDTGLFTWLESRGRVKKGDVAGTSNARGYIVIRIDNVKYLAHRLVFLYRLGWMPAEVDHDNQVKNDNRWENLNPVTHATNMRNQKLFNNNTSGHCGVFYDKRAEKWRARTKVDGKRVHLGRFTHKQDAIAARAAADIKYAFHDNHGQPKKVNAK